jgi:hypothetical protein
LKRDFDLHQLRSLTQDMNPDRLMEVGIAIAQRLPASKRAEFAEFLKKIGSDDQVSEAKFCDTEKRGGLDDSSESGEP